MRRIPAGALAADVARAAPTPSAHADLARGFEVRLAADGAYLVHAEAVATVRVAPDGADIAIDTDAADERWPLLVRAQALPLAATLRGLETLHAASVRIDGRIVALAADSGVGKSSVCAALLRAGATLHADDVVALELDGNAVLAFSGPAQVSLVTGSAADAAGPHWQGTPQLLAGKTFRSVERIAAPGPLAAIYLLERTGDPDGAITTVRRGLAATLRDLAFVRSVASGARLVRQLDVHAAVAASVPVHRIRSPRSWDATETAARIRRHLRS